MADPVAEAIAVIHGADLTPYEHLALADDFVQTAYDPQLAAAEILRVINAREPGVSIAEVLLAFKQDWQQLLELVAKPAPVTDSVRQLLDTRDHGRCCVTPATAYLAPPGIKSLKETLFAEFDHTTLYNVLLLTPSIGCALRNGHIQVYPAPDYIWATASDETLSKSRSSSEASRFLYIPPYLAVTMPPEKFRNIFLANGKPMEDESLSRLTLRTKNPETLPLPDLRLLQMQSKFGHALRSFYLEQIVKCEGVFRSESKLSDFWSRPSQLFFRRIWRCFPLFIRSRIYHYMFRRAYRQDISPVVLQLPMGLYAKRCDRGDDNEPAALKLLEKYAPRVPAPLLIDKFQDLDDVKWIIMTKLPGIRALGTMYRMSYAQRRKFTDDLASVLDQIHSIPNNTGHLFCGAGGGRIYDWRTASAFGCGPFDTEDAFNRHITGGAQDVYEQIIPGAFSKKHKSVFTHSDLFFCNVLVDDGRLSGIVDWESSGFMPEYWDYTKAMRVTKIKEERAVYQQIWGDQYDHELLVEKHIWNRFPFGGPNEAENERAVVVLPHWPRASFRVNC